MCIFTTRVERVSGTRIFARLDGREQYVAYQMHFAAAGATAMVLPIPIVPGAADDAVRFVDLSTQRHFFEHLDRLFPRAVDGDLLVSSRAQAGTLAVHDVGAFEASFVPTAAAFARLDRRFRLPSTVLAALPAYADFGFVVFKLKPAGGLLARVGLRKPLTEPHPMAFAFPTRHRDRLFFPTVHVHDGEVHPRAAFDHWLYAQAPDGPADWERSTGHAGEQLRAAETGGLLADDLWVHRRQIAGEHPNEDVYATVAGGT